MKLHRIDHIGINVEDLQAATSVVQRYFDGRRATGSTDPENKLGFPETLELLVVWITP